MFRVNSRISLEVGLLGLLPARPCLTTARRLTFSREVDILLGTKKEIVKHFQSGHGRDSRLHSPDNSRVHSVELDFDCGYPPHQRVLAWCLHHLLDQLRGQRRENWRCHRPGCDQGYIAEASIASISCKRKPKFSV